MPIDDVELLEFLRAIGAGDIDSARRAFRAQPELAFQRLKSGATREAAPDFFLERVGHYVFSGDTALHIAAAGYRAELVRELVSAGADVCAGNRRGAQPLHYAADGEPGGNNWRPDDQAATITCLIEAGADPNAVDISGVAPLHRAVRTRCSSAVRALLDGGADPQRANKSGSTPLTLATHDTGRGGSGSAHARLELAEIIKVLVLRGSTA